MFSKTNRQIQPSLRKSFQATLDPGVCLNQKLSKSDQSIMVFLSNYEKSNFLSYFPFRDLIKSLFICIFKQVTLKHFRAV